MSKSYNASDIKVLEEVEAIRQNPGMFIGLTHNPVHLIEEALDNALDECAEGHADIVAVIIDTKKGIFSVMDNLIKRLSRTGENGERSKKVDKSATETTKPEEGMLEDSDETGNPAAGSSE